MAYCGPRGIALSTFLSWPQADQDAALEWSAHESRRCPSCGTHPDDDRPRHWHPQVCVGCQQKQRAQDDLRADGDTTRGLGLVTAAGAAVDCPICSLA